MSPVILISYHASEKLLTQIRPQCRIADREKVVSPDCSMAIVREEVRCLLPSSECEVWLQKHGPKLAELLWWRPNDRADANWQNCNINGRAMSSVPIIMKSASL